MPIPLTDGSVVGDGSQIGMFPVLADQRLDKPAALLRTSTNPRMDLVLLVVQDATAQSGPAAATAPPGMSAAQFALVQRMLAARQRGAQASSNQGVPDPKRGPQIHLVLWRMGDDSSVAWSVVLDFDKVMDPAPNAPGASQQEHEDVYLHDVAWSPKGDRVAVLASVRRSPAASTSNSSASARTKRFLRTYSVQDGRLLSTVVVGPAKEVANFQEPLTMRWLDIDFNLASDAVDGSSESLLIALPPLPVLPAADTFASAGSTGNLMPHQLRMMQMSGQKPSPTFQFPSHLALQGRGPLANVPHLAKSAMDLKLLEGGDAAITLSPDSALPLAPESVILVSRPQSMQADLVLDGQSNIGSLQLPQKASQHDHVRDHSSPLSLSHDMTRIFSIATCSNLATSHYQVLLPLPLRSRYGPLDVRRRIAAFCRSSHLLRFYLGYALDTASALQQVYQQEFVKKVTSEWTKNIDDLSLKFGGDMKYELVNVLLTGRAGPAAEQFLLGNLTEGVLTRLEKQSHTATYALKKLISESLKPALERCIVCMTDLLGQTRFFGEDDASLRAALKVLQASLDSTLSLAKEVDLEALISQEFYRWCRTERERQERIKQDQDEPRLPVTYDVHYVATYIDRGFENDDMHARLGNDLPAEAMEGIMADTPRKVSLQEIFEGARAFLAASGIRNVKKEQDEMGKVPGQMPLAIVPTLTKAVELIGDRLIKLLDAKLEDAAVEHTSSLIPANAYWKLALEAAPALSLSSSVDVQEATRRICMTSVVSSNALFSAYILRSDPEDPSSSSAILAIRQSTSADPAESVFARFSIPSTDNIAIVDIGFYGEAELLVLATLPSTSTGVLLAFNIANLPFTSPSGDVAAAVTPTRATEFEPDFKPARLAVNTNKQTVAVIDEDGKRIFYLDVSMVEIGDVAMQEEA